MQIKEKAYEHLRLFRLDPHRIKLSVFARPSWQMKVIWGHQKGLLFELTIYVST